MKFSQSTEPTITCTGLAPLLLLVAALTLTSCAEKNTSVTVREAIEAGDQNPTSVTAVPAGRCRTQLDCTPTEECVIAGSTIGFCRVSADPLYAPAPKSGNRPAPPAGLLTGEAIRGRP